MSTVASLARQTFRTSRLLEYFSEKQLTLQTGHGPERCPMAACLSSLSAAYRISTTCWDSNVVGAAIQRLQGFTGAVKCVPE
jgi:hypothetical protein